MTPKEKADELMDKMYYIGRYDDQESYNPTMAWERVRQCALIAVDEILDALDKSLIDADIEWFKQVKQEIEKL